MERDGRDRDDIDRDNVEVDVDNGLAAVISAGGTADHRLVKSEAPATCHRSCLLSCRSR